MMDMYQRCPQCMHRVDKAAPICQNCNYNLENIPPASYNLAPGSLLQGRYQLGNPLYDFKDSITYIALDTELDTIVSITEFFPKEIAHRAENGQIMANEGKNSLYIQLGKEFADLYNALAKLRTLSPILPVYSIFEQNHTCYIIMEYIKAITLREYLAENYGELPWSTVSPMFSPLLKTLKHLHEIGIVHGAISPETILVDQDKHLKLTHFSIPAFRQNLETVSPVLFKGYAAPEQYTGQQSIGSWTDVYGLAAVLYKSLTGTMPSESNTRAFNDNLISPDILNAQIPKTVSIAIMSALTLSPKLRTQTMDDLLADLITPPRSTTQYSLEYSLIKKESDDKNINVSSPKKQRNYLWISMGISLIILLFASAILLLFFFFPHLFSH